MAPPALNPKVPNSAAPAAPTAITGPIPGNIRLATAPPNPIPPASPTAPPTAAPMALPIPGCSAASTATAPNSFSEASGVSRLIRSLEIPVARSCVEPRCASDRDVNTPATDIMAFLQLSRWDSCALRVRSTRGLEHQVNHLESHKEQG